MMQRYNMRGVVLLGGLALAVAATASETGKIEPGKPGCWSNGKWYPEGARIAADIRSRIAIDAVSVCRNGAWVFEKPASADKSRSR